MWQTARIVMDIKSFVDSCLLCEVWNISNLEYWRDPDNYLEKKRKNNLREYCYHVHPHEVLLR